LKLIAWNPDWDKVKLMAIYRLCRIAVLFAALIVAICLPAFTQTVSFSNFSSSGGLKLAGTAAIAKTDDGAVLRLTKATCCSAGSAFTAKAVPFAIGADTFSTFFQFRLTDPGGLSAGDGIVFVLRTAGSPALGQTGEFEGYDGIGQSLGVKFDTFKNEGEINETTSRFRPTARCGTSSHKLLMAFRPALRPSA
jgi:hypothetical protein